MFSVFRGMCSSLWLLWELAITGQPILVQGQNPELVSDAVMCIVGLISPLCFGGDYRPYFSLYDPDFKEVRALALFPARVSHGVTTLLCRRCAGLLLAHCCPCQLCDSSRSGSFSSPVIIGSTNPFLTKCFESWPNALWICTPVAADCVAGGGGGGGSSAGGSPVPASPVRVGSSSSGDSATKVRPKVLPKSALLTSVLPSPGDEAKAKLSVACRAEPLVPPDSAVLGQLLSIRPEDELGTAHCEHCSRTLGRTYRVVDVWFAVRMLAYVRHCRAATATVW